MNVLFFNFNNKINIDKFKNNLLTWFIFLKCEVLELKSLKGLTKH